MWGAILLAALQSAPISVEIAADAEVTVARRDITLADIARLHGGRRAERLRMGSRVIATLPPGRSLVRLDRRALRDLARRRTGGLSIAGADTGVVTIRYQGPPSGPVLATCWEAATPIAAGAAIQPADLAPTDCSSEAALAPLRYERVSGLVRAAADIAPGAKLGRLELGAAPAVESGAAMTLTSSVGPVSISRPVQALQAGRSGRRIFVRDADGSIFSIRLAADGEGGR